MTPSTYHPPLEGGETPGMGKLTATIIECISYRMQITQGVVAKAPAGSGWSTVAEMSVREFTSSYRGYFPKCGMDIRAEAVIADVFDQLAIAFDDDAGARVVNALEHLTDNAVAQG